MSVKQKPQSRWDIQRGATTASDSLNDDGWIKLRKRETNCRFFSEKGEKLCSLMSFCFSGAREFSFFCKIEKGFVFRARQQRSIRRRKCVRDEKLNERKNVMKENLPRDRRQHGLLTNCIAIMITVFNAKRRPHKSNKSSSDGPSNSITSALYLPHGPK